MTQGTSIQIRHADGRGRMYAAIIEGLDPKYIFARRFVQMHKAEHIDNCYWTFRSSEAVGDGAVVETVSANYKGKERRSYLQLRDGQWHDLTAADVAAIFAGTTVAA